MEQDTGANQSQGWLGSFLNTEIYAGKSLADYLTLDMLASFAGSLAGALFIIVLGVLLAGFVSRRIRRMAERHASLDPTLFSFLANLARYTILGFTALFVLNTFGVQTTSIIAVIGAAGLAIGLALQGTLSNVAAGVMIILFRPLKVGEFVEVNGVMGTVKDITLNYTELADLSNVKVIVPNAEVWGNTIQNYSVYDTRRAEWTFGVGYDVDLAQAEAVIRDTVLSDARAHSTPEPFVQVKELGGSSVNFRVRVWCSAEDYFAFQHDMERAVKEALDAAEIDIPYPTRTLIHEGGALRPEQDEAA